ncbi:DNA (cytosine-5-)-methyltransferase [Limibacter armeniacum]|uniref:DNA cytosine methyltransferase n=1 Tax=Limibacter armeniacum TaxID=466084 RepID=UPI002FE5C072
MTHGSLFSGIGGFELGAMLAGIRTVWSCEIEPFQRAVLKERFNSTKQYDDITKLSYPEKVDIISGGFPCQDISIAGKGKGITGKRSGLWSEMYRIIGEVRPKYVIIENSPMLTVRGFERVLADLSKIGYDAEWQCLSGTTFGIQQGRQRIYCIAYSSEELSECSSKTQVFRKFNVSGQLSRIYPGWKNRRDIPQPRTYGKSNDLPNQLDRVGSLGNAVMPVVAWYLFFCITMHHKMKTNN